MAHEHVLWVWEAPPPAGASRCFPLTRHAVIAAGLRTHPGQWLRVTLNGSPTLHQSIKRAILTAYRPAGSFEAETHLLGDGCYGTWARYVGVTDPD